MRSPLSLSAAVFCLAGLASPCVSWSQTAPPIASVNGTPIAALALEQLAASGVQQGLKDTPELRASLKNELIAKEVLAQEARRLGLDKDPVFVQRLSLLRNNLMADALVNAHFVSNPITEDMLKADYQRQVDALADAQECLISHIVLATQEQALDALKQLRAGQPFEQLAKTLSIDNSGKTGGSLGWLLPVQLVPPLGNVVANMSKGAVSVAPIQTPVGWQIVKVEDKRAYKVPSFEQAKPQVQESVFNARRNAYVAQLLKQAKIE